MRTLLACLLLASLAGCIGSLREDDCQVALAPESGSIEGAWSRPVTIGTQSREWQPAPLPWADAEHLSRANTLNLTLDWSNTPQGGADFGIAVGVDGLDQYWNQAFQANFGSFTETLQLTSNEFRGEGWSTADHLQAGPSISTGGYSATSPISYTLSWEATFLPPAGPACAPGESGHATMSATPSPSAATAQNRPA